VAEDSAREFADGHDMERNETNVNGRPIASKKRLTTFTRQPQAWRARQGELNRSLEFALTILNHTARSYRDERWASMTAWSIAVRGFAGCSTPITAKQRDGCRPSEWILRDAIYRDAPRGGTLSGYNRIAT
jgi:hypothetical protein